MDGLEFYSFLHQQFITRYHPIYGAYTFNRWIRKQDGSLSFQFNIRGNNPKSISQDLLIMAWEANVLITDDWLVINGFPKFHKDCRLSILNHLITTNNFLR